MNIIPAFPKIFAIGTNYIANIFNDEVEVTEKVDGSQFIFGKINGEVVMRSRGTQQHIGNPDKLFSGAVAYVSSIELPEGMIFYGETLQTPRHNTLKYGRVPKNHLALFGAMDTSFKFYPNIEDWAKKLGVDHVPVLYRGKIDSTESLLAMLERESFLGEAKIEGVVVKNYHQPFLLGGQPIPLMSGKYVSEAFKETNRKGWDGEKGNNKLEAFYESFRTEARWNKAVQRLRDDGKLKGEPSDIGLLMKELHLDLEAEEKEDVKEFFWRLFSNDLKRKATAGFAEWYKKQLMEGAFNINRDARREK